MCLQHGLPLNTMRISVGHYRVSFRTPLGLPSNTTRSQIKARAPIAAQNEASSPFGAKGELASMITPIGESCPEICPDKLSMNYGPTPHSYIPGDPHHPPPPHTHTHTPPPPPPPPHTHTHTHTLFLGRRCGGTIADCIYKMRIADLH